jgi:hypothetical protein
LLIYQFPNFPVEAIDVVAKELFNNFKSPDKENLIKLIFSFPSDLAVSFGFCHTIFVCDHVDLADISFPFPNDPENSLPIYESFLNALKKIYIFVR